MGAKRVYLIPGFGASDLGVLATGEKLWWDIAISPSNGLGKMKLASNGIDPDPIIGAQMGVDLVPQSPWGGILGLLTLQLGTEDWAPEVTVYDWRLDVLRTAGQLAQNIVARNSPELPATLVAHSMGGFVAALAWAKLAEQGKTNYVRRIIAIGTPWQGSYMPVLWLVGALGMVQELTAVYSLVSVLPNVNPLVWELAYLNMLALSWPAFYALFPFYEGSQALADPNRRLLYNAANYPASIRPDQHWLDYSRNTVQPAVTAAVNTIPPWVLTTVAGTGIGTPTQLRLATVPLVLTALPDVGDGDQIVAADNALQAISARVEVPGSHSNLPLGLTVTGKLADLIRDDRPAPTPPPRLETVREAIPYLVSDPPESEPQSPILCIGGG